LVGFPSGFLTNLCGIKGFAFSAFPRILTLKLAAKQIFKQGLFDDQVEADE
jgi:hypothetical protein